MNFMVFLHRALKILRIEVMNFIRRIFKITYRTIKEKHVLDKRVSNSKRF